MTLAVRLAAGLPIVLGLSVASWQAARVGYADWLTRKGTLESLRRVIAFAPEDAQARQALALLLLNTDPAAAKTHFEQATRNNPHDSRSVVELALLVENDGDYARAEKLLLHAAQVDALYFPRWSLANYYLRRKDEPAFWRWARSAASMSFGSLGSLYRLAAYVASENRSVVSLLEINDPAILRDYLDFAIFTGRLKEVEEVLRKLDRERDAAAVLHGCDALIRAGRTDNAIALCPSSGEFRDTAAESGFEWHYPRVEGTDRSILGAPPALRLRFYGRQPEQVELLWRYLPVSGPAELAISASLCTPNLPRESGLRWKLFDPTTGAEVAGQQGWLSAADWTAVRVLLLVRRTTKGLRLALVYERAPGTVRTEGDLFLRQVRISSGAQ